MPVKQLQARVEVKDEDKGEVDLVFSRFNVIDKDGDVTLPGAFSDVDGTKVPVSAYGHQSWEGKLPVGVAKIDQRRGEAIAHAKFFLDTTHGVDTFRTVKHLAKDGLGDWSYGYKAQDYSFGEFEGQRVRFLKKLGVDEVSPVLVGAGVNTRTISAKGFTGDTGTGEGNRHVDGWTGVIAPHETDTVDRQWIPADVIAAFGLDPDMKALRRAFAWQDIKSDPERVASYAFLHHDENGDANVRAVMLGIAQLNGAKGAPSIEDDATRKAVYDHLIGHLRDADLPIPMLRTGDAPLKMNDEALVVLADLSSLTSLAGEVGASRKARGKSHTHASELILGWVREELKRFESILDDPNAGLVDLFLDRIRRDLGK